MLKPRRYNAQYKHRGNKRSCQTIETRDMGGIIVIDFIDENPEKQKLLFKSMKSLWQKA
jgi:Ribonuclease G/E